MMTLKDRVEFFFKHAGFSYRPEKETREQGRLRCALSLARAEEALASHPTAWVEWEGEDMPPDEEWRGQIEEGSLLWVLASIFVDDDCVASLGGILLKSMDEPYVRVVEAELALEAGVGRAGALRKLADVLDLKESELLGMVAEKGGN